MKFTCTREHLRLGLSLTHRVIGKNTSLPILKNLLLDVSNGRLSIAATDIEIGIVAHVHGKLEEEGRIAVPSVLLVEYIQRLPEEPITLWTEGLLLHVQCGEYHAQFTTQDPVDFPIVPEIQGGASFILPTDEMAHLLEQATIAAAQDVLRPELATTFWKTDGSHLIVAATDSFRLIEIKKECDGDGMQFLLPIRSSQEAYRFLSQLDGEVTTTVDGQSIEIRHPKAFFISRLTNGLFPDYSSIIPDQSESAMTIERGEVEAALQSLLVFTRGGVSEVRAVFHQSSKTLSLFSTADQLGSTAVDVKVIQSTGKDQEVLFNTRYLLDGIRLCSTPEIFIEVSHGGGPLMIRPSEQGSPSLLYLVMPIQHE